MILEIGKLGIIEMMNNNSEIHREKIIIHRNMDNNFCYINGTTITLGYNEKICCDNIDNANRLFEIIEGVFTGTRQEKIERILKDDIQ